MLSTGAMDTRFLVLSLLCPPTAASAETLIYNINGIQIAADGQLDRFTGLVIDDDGKVEQVVRRDNEIQRPIEHEVDEGGRTLFPGLIDAHGHVLGLGLQAIQLDVTGTASLTELQ